MIRQKSLGTLTEMSTPWQANVMIRYTFVTIRDDPKKTVDNQKKIRRERDDSAATHAPIRLPACVA